MPYPHRNPDEHPRRGESGVMHAALTEVRNGIPVTAPYVYPPEDPAEIEQAERAWQAVAEIQARLRGEPAPPPMAEPWNLPPCPGCGYRMRCSCGGA